MWLLQSSIAVLSLLSQLSSAHNIQLAPHSRECFYETLHKDDRMAVTFQVGDREFGGAGNLEVDFWVRFKNFSGFAKEKYKPDFISYHLSSLTSKIFNLQLKK